jgi:hypothetical protein
MAKANCLKSNYQDPYKTGDTQPNPPNCPKTNKNPRKTKKTGFSVSFRQKHEKV